MRLFISFMLLAILSACASTKISTSVAPSDSSDPRLAGDEKTNCLNFSPNLKKARPTPDQSEKKTTNSSSVKASSSIDALFWCTKAAEKGDASSQYVLADMYESGTGVPKSQVEAIRWYKESAKGGNANAQYKVGLMYGKGEGVTQDKNEATTWYKKAAEQGHVEAEFTLGYRYEFGKGVAQNYSEAIRWYNKAAEKGNSSAQNYLGVMTAAGHGVPQNNVEAYKWFNIAAVSGQKEYVNNRDKIAKKLNRTQLSEGQKLASDWVKAHSEAKK